MTSEWVQAIAGIATFFAASLAVWATFRAPKLAAEFAERLRSDSQLSEERRRLKMYVFTTLMQYRAAIITAEAVNALNLIDVVFIDAPEVRQAWDDFCVAANQNPHSAASIIERYNQIIERMVRHLGLGQDITIANIRNCYYPRGLGQRDEAAMLETEDKLKRFKQPEGPQLS